MEFILILLTKLKFKEDSKSFSSNHQNNKTDSVLF